MTDGNELPLVVRDYFGACESRDAGRLASCVCSDVRYAHRSNAGPPCEVYGAAAFLLLVEAAFRAFRRRRYTIRGVVAGTAEVAVELDCEGVVADDLPNGWRAGQTVRLFGVSLFTLRDGKIAGIRDYL